MSGEVLKTVVTPEGSKDINDLIIGYKVLGRNNVQNELTGLGKRVLDREWFREQELENEFKWYLINGTYEFFGTQSVILQSGGYGVCHVSELKVGWELTNDAGTAVAITSIEEIPSEEPFIKLDISGDHSYISQGILLHNSSRYWDKQNASANWNATAPTNWASTSGGADNASVPGASDDVTFDGAGVGGNDASTISATIAVLSFTVTSGYTNTITHNATLTVAGNVALNTSYTIAGSSGLTISAASTITSGGKTWPNSVQFTGNNTKTLSGNFIISGSLSIGGNTVLNLTTAETVSAAGLAMATNSLSGTAKIILTGGTWSGNFGVNNDLDIAGNVTISGSVTKSNNTLTYISGTVTATGSTLTIAASTTLTTAGITWNNIVMSASQTLTINSLFSVGGILNASTGTHTFAGSNGFTAATFTSGSTGAATLTFNDGVTYTITTALNAFTSRTGSILTFTSDHASNKAIITLQQGATCNVLANFTRIDASGGRPILSFNGTITDCINVFGYTDVKWKPVRGFGRGQRRKEISNRDKAVEYL